MAEPLSRSATIRLLEDAVRVLRQSPPSVWLCHPIGSVPCALALLLAWSSATSSRTTDLAWAAQSLAAALLLVWMNCWRAVFAGKLRRQLSGAADTPWTLQRAAGLVAAQSFFGASKLIVLPLAGLVMFPWSGAIAVYRYLAVLSDRDDLTPRRMLSRARHLAKFEKGQGWLILALLLFLQTAATINLFIVLALLPQIVRILTGFETAFSRSGMYFAFNGSFALTVLAVSWITFDPFVQAVYTVRCFQAESRETGEDLRSGLRRLRGLAGVAAALLLLFAALPLRADVSPPELKESVRQAMQAPEYDWRLPAAPAAANTPWIVKITDRIVAVARRIGDAVGSVIDRVFRWLGDQLKKILPEPVPGAAPAASLHWILGVSIAVLAVAGGIAIWHRRRSRQPKRATPKAPAAVRLDAADLTPDVLPEESWIELAERALAEQDFLHALRAYYLASLAWLGRQEILTIHPGKTNREYAVELRRRTRAYPDARELFAANIVAFERAWYGEYPVSPDDVAAFRERAQAIRNLLGRPAGVAA